MNMDQEVVPDNGSSINAAREDIRSGLHHDNGDAEEYDEDKDEHGIEEGEDGEGEDLRDDYDDDDHNGLSALDTLGENFELNVVAKGQHMCHNCTYTQLTF